MGAPAWKIQAMLAKRGATKWSVRCLGLAGLAIALIACATKSLPVAIGTFTANPAQITTGQSSTLSWNVTGTAPISLGIDHGVGEVSGKTSTTVKPTQTTIYTLTAANAAGTATAQATAQATVTVNAAPAPPSFTSFTSVSITGGAAYQWQIAGGTGDTLTCALDATGNGTTDAIIPNCGTITSHSYAFTTPGRYVSELTVTDSRGRSDTATVNTIAAGMSTTARIWATQTGTNGIDQGHGITSDANGNTTLVGYTDDALPGLINAGAEDIVIAKYPP